VHVAASYHGTPRSKVHEIRRISFDWPNPNVVIFRRALTNSVSYIRCRIFVLPEKVGQSFPRSPDLAPIDWPYTSFYRHSVARLALESRLLCFRDIAGSVVLFSENINLFNQSARTYNRQTDGIWQYRATHYIPSRGKKEIKN